ncbi:MULTISPECIES: GTP cyclohydrolase II [Azospira]|jgi:GTP cyclohydrolase II|uniref:GTP cyclohydrolase-2 n=2 Tax=Azospira oryzae TaxID=146939 RepID=G8QH34_AZOOP|nr:MULTISPECIES: GTP cyclohydrolase II [Azospira]TLS19124.1 MAG: GTP cyclohydrolase II [Betaproteobacteria bacterium]AEV25126.1 GTP cyclohydrolase II [Azospira oryzae PS]MBP7488252.1 GTP cyclohydrolase II [Azospira sp.]MDK9691334.1 GTP cyclohydrolase II [Azospira sp.]RZT76534.1 GTP cyclohydrolase II [Azospira oryzae]
MTSTPSLPAVALVASCELPTPWAVFRLHGFQETASGKEHLALTLGQVGDGVPALTRLHSECLTGDGLFSLRCDCGPQLEAALAAIAKEGRGVLLYLRQEGRGIGLLDKLRAYALQDQGLDTVDANRALGLPDDARDYGVAAAMLNTLGVPAVRLMTNNPAKVSALTARGVNVTERVPHVAGRGPRNQDYLETKAARMGHLLPWLEQD